MVVSWKVWQHQLKSWGDFTSELNVFVQREISQKLRSVFRYTKKDFIKVNLKKTNNKTTEHHHFSG